jgi:hypothetical protein
MTWPRRLCRLPRRAAGHGGLWAPALAGRALEDLGVGGVARQGATYRLRHGNGQTWQEPPAPHPALDTRLEHLTAAPADSVWLAGTIRTIERAWLPGTGTASDPVAHDRWLIARYDPP